MSFGMNRVELIGRLGADVTVNHLTSGGRVANLSIATDESYLNRQTGEKVDKTEWHRIVTFQDGLIDMLERHAKKGRLVHAEGKLQTRPLVEARRGVRPVLDGDSGRPRSQGPVPRQAERCERQRRAGRGGAGAGARERFGDAGRRRPRRRPTIWTRTRYHSESGPSLPSSFPTGPALRRRSFFSAVGFESAAVRASRPRYARAARPPAPARGRAGRYRGVPPSQRSPIMPNPYCASAGAAS